jgi:Tfp pilus assembly protein PilN
MNVRLNLATKPLLSHRRFLVGAGLLAAFGGILFLVLGWHVYSSLRAQEALRRKEQDNDRKAALLQTRRRELDDFFSRPENARLNERAAFVNGIIDGRTFDWTQMFMDLEKIMPAGVHVVSIHPELQKGRMFVRLTVAAASDESKIKFLRAMEDSPAFSNVELLSVRGSQASADQSLELNAVYSRS